jgi:hypothetical protein
MRGVIKDLGIVASPSRRTTAFCGSGNRHHLRAHAIGRGVSLASKQPRKDMPEQRPTRLLRRLIPPDESTP